MKALTGTTILTLLFAIPLAAAEKPEGWFLSGADRASYTIEVDRSVFREGKSSARLASNGKPTGFGTMMQSFDATEYRGKRLRLSAFVKANNVVSWAGLWMRVDGPDKTEPLAFDNMYDRPIDGTVPWKRFEVVLDVASNARAIAFGILLDGTGTVWLDEVTLDVVNKTVPTTGVQGRPRKPTNLSLEK